MTALDHPRIPPKFKETADQVAAHQATCDDNRDNLEPPESTPSVFFGPVEPSLARQPRADFVDSIMTEDMDDAASDSSDSDSSSIRSFQSSSTHFSSYRDFQTSEERERPGRWSADEDWEDHIWEGRDHIVGWRVPNHICPIDWYTPDCWRPVINVSLDLSNAVDRVPDPMAFIETIEDLYRRAVVFSRDACVTH